MAKRSERLRPVQQIAATREQEAAREMAKARSYLEAAQARLVELINFREDYARKFLERGAQGITVTKMREYYGFIQRIDQAIAYQQTLIAQAQTAYAQRQRIWGQRHSRMRAMDKLAARYRQQEQLEADRREQKETDERAQRASGRERVE